MTKIRVAHVITRLVRGGAQENTFHSVRLANRERYRVDLIAGPPHGAEGSMEKRIEDAGVAIHRAPHLLRKPAPLRDLHTLNYLTQLFKRNQYDIVHTHTSKAGLLGRIAAERAGVPHVIHTPHGNVFHGYFHPAIVRAYVWLERHAARRTDRIIELTPVGVEEHLNEGIGQREQFRVIFSGIDTTPYADAIAQRAATRATFAIPDDAILIGGVGRLEPVKGFKHFVEAALQLDDEGNKRYFIHAGTGTQEAELKALAAPLGDRFGFLGQRNDIPQLMAAMDLLVVPSINEGMGRVLLEAGAAATPVIASDVGGIPDIVDDGETGLLVKPGDTHALVEAMRTLIAAPERRYFMGDTARAKVVPHYSLECMVAQLEDLYEEVLAHPKADDIPR